MFKRDDICAVLVVAALLLVNSVNERLDVQSNLPSDVMLIKLGSRHREPAKVQWLYGKPYCSPNKDNSGMGLLLPKGHVDGVVGTEGWEPLTPKMYEFYSIGAEVKQVVVGVGP